MTRCASQAHRSGPTTQRCAGSCPWKRSRTASCAWSTRPTTARSGCGIAGRVTLPDPIGGRLDLWWLEQYGGGLFLPLKDGSAGRTSYGAGRYLLDTAKGADLGGSWDGEHGGLVIDLNFAYHPSCRYDDKWQCPLAPPGNTIATPVEAGERL